MMMTVIITIIIIQKFARQTMSAITTKSDTTAVVRLAAMVKYG